MSEHIPGSLLPTKAAALQTLRAMESAHFDVPAFEVVPLPLGAPDRECARDCLPVLKWPCVKEFPPPGVIAARSIVRAAVDRLGLDGPVWLRTSMSLSARSEVSYPGVNYSWRCTGPDGLARGLEVLGSALERPYVRWYRHRFGVDVRREGTELIVGAAASGDFYGVAYLRDGRAAVDLYEAARLHRQVRCAETDPVRMVGAGEDWGDLPGGGGLRAALQEIHEAHSRSGTITEVEFYCSEGARPTVVQYRTVPMRGGDDGALLQQWPPGPAKLIDFRQVPRDLGQIASRLAELAKDEDAVAVVRDLAFRECDAFALYLAADLTGLPAPHSVLIVRDGTLPRSHFASVLCEDPATRRVGQLKADRVPPSVVARFEVRARHGTRIDLAPGRSRTHVSEAEGKTTVNNTHVFQRTDVAERYDRSRLLPDRAVQEVLDVIVKALDGASPELVVDLGCGTGRFLAPLANTLAAKVIGVEPSEAMLAVAAGKTYPGIELRRGDAEHLPVLDDSAGLVFASMVLHHLPSLPIAMGEVARVLRPGGVAVLRNATRETRPSTPHVRFFPEVEDLDWLRIPSRAEVAEAGVLHGLVPAETVTLAQEHAATYGAYYERIARRPLSDLIAISDDAFERGLERLSAHCAERWDDGPVDIPIDFMVLRKAL
ncbi:methyltransferase domain-containing protein [Streptomyces sp. NPDC006864]|uniref:methyltransferase domain-containing protein n=1 Tax=Streptomyces sp. NPDC006864 TaxID=3154780 RepID=UPI0034535778